MTYQQERDHFIAQFARTFPELPHAANLAGRFLRLSTTLHRLAEAQCNGDWPFDNGQRQVSPCPLCESGTAPSALTGGPLAMLALRDHHQPGCMTALHRPCSCNVRKTKVCPDCRTTAAAVQLSWKLPAYKVVTQGDPRGCVLWLYPHDASNEDIDNGRARSRGIAVPGRY